MDSDKIIDLGEWAEANFSAKCARAGVTRNRSRQDRTGWDYFVEFRAKQIPGIPADLQPADISARVQVKSKAKGPPYVDLRLSNALRFAKDPLPCFLILYQATQGGEPVRIYARHIWTEEISQALLRARKADVEGREDLNKLTLRYSFSDADDHSDDLIRWMEQIVSGRDRYAEEKQALVSTVGFEDDRIHGSMSIAPEDLEALIDHQIGLNDVAPPVTMTIIERRFGIDSRTPLYSGTPDTAQLRSHPLPARVRVRPPEDPDFWLDGEIYLPSVQGPLEIMKLRVVTDFLEIVVTGSKQGTVTLINDPDRQLGLNSHRARIDVLRIAASGPLRLMVAVEGKPNIPADTVLQVDKIDRALEQFSNAIGCLEKASAGVLPTDLTVSQREIDIAWNGLVDFNAMVTGTDVAGNFEFEEEPDERLRSVTASYFFDFVEVGGWVFGAVVRRVIETLEIDGVHARLAFGTARVVEAMIRRGRGEDIIAELYGLYQQALAPEKKTAVELFEGSHRAMLRASGNSAVLQERVTEGNFDESTD